MAKALLDLASARRIVLIQMNTAAFSYEPVLRQLQSTKQLLLQPVLRQFQSSKQLLLQPVLRQLQSTKQLLLEDEIMLCDQEQELRKSPQV